MLTRKQFRKLCLAILDDKHGTNGEAFALIHEYCELYQSKDIILQTENFRGRFFLKEDHNLRLE